MDVDKSKLFVGGISRETSEDTIRVHFSKYGTVSGSLVAKNKNTKIPRGFGFVWFTDPSFADKALEDSHVILGRTVEVKKAIPKNEQIHYQQQQQQLYHQHPSHQKNSGFGKNCNNGNSNCYFRTKKVFVGGLSSSLTEEQFKNYFERFGRMVDVVVMRDSSTNRPRGFGFVTFDSEESVDEVMLKTFHELNGRFVEVKRAVPKGGISSDYSSVTELSVREPSNESSQPVNYHPLRPECQIIPGHALYPEYGGVGWYVHGAGIYRGGYTWVGSGRPSFGVTPMAPSSPWTGPLMIGAGSCLLPYSNACLYPAYVNGEGGIIGMMGCGYGGTIRLNVSGKFIHFPGGLGQPPPDATPPIEEEKLEVDSSCLKGCNDSAPG